MTVISVASKYGGLSGRGELEGVREYTKVFIVKTDAASDGVKTVGNALGLPHKGDVYSYQGETDAGALCWSVAPRQDPNNQNVWEVTCQYSSDLKGGSGSALGGDPAHDVDNPLNTPPVVTWSNWIETEIVTHDRLGNMILNKADCFLNPPLTRRIKRRAVTVIRNEATYPVALDQNYTDCVNTDLFYNWPPGTARLDDVTATGHFAQAQFYWQVKYDIQFKKPDWKFRVQNAGTQYYMRNEWGAQILNDDGTMKLFNNEDDGVYSTNIVLLDPLGFRLTQDEVAAGMANYLEIEIYEPKAFSALNL